METHSVTFDSSMSDEDFLKWLRLKGISQKDSKSLSGKYNFKVYVTKYNFTKIIQVLSIAIMQWYVDFL